LRERKQPVIFERNLSPSQKHELFQSTTCRLRKNTGFCQLSVVSHWTFVNRPCSTPFVILAASALELPMPNKTKQNEAQFCRPSRAFLPVISETFDLRRRQNARVMSPKMGPPAAATKPNRWPPNDLRLAPRKCRKQNSTILGRQHDLSPTVPDPTDKTRPCSPQPLVVYKPKNPNLPVFCCSVLQPAMDADTVLMRTVHGRRGTGAALEPQQRTFNESPCSAPSSPAPCSLLTPAPCNRADSRR
jgi:hypothetical protein